MRSQWSKRSFHCLYNPLSPALFVIRASCNPSHSAMHSRVVLSFVSEKTFLHLPFCPICQVAPGQVVSLRGRIEMLKYVEKRDAAHVTRHNGIKSNPNVAPPIVQPATMSLPPSNFHRGGFHLPLATRTSASFGFFSYVDLLIFSQAWLNLIKVN